MEDAGRLAPYGSGWFHVPPLAGPASSETGLAEGTPDF